MNTVCVGSESMPVAASIVLGYAGVGEASIELILKTVRNPFFHFTRLLADMWNTSLETRRTM